MNATAQPAFDFVTIEVLGHTRFDRPCRGAQCGAPISWYQTHPNRKWIAFNLGAAPVEIYPMSRSDRLFVMKTEDVHWKSCANPRDFKRKKR